MENSFIADYIITNAADILKENFVTIEKSEEAFIKCCEKVHLTKVKALQILKVMEEKQIIIVTESDIKQFLNYKK